MLNRSMAAMMSLLPGGTRSARGYFGARLLFIVRLVRTGSSGRNFNMLVDGADNKEDNCGGTFIVYSLEGVQEFKTLTTGANAEYGRGTATVLVATKSGTNQLHGSVFGYGRNQSLVKISTTCPIRRTAGSASRPSAAAQYGGSFGGPIMQDKAWVLRRGRTGRAEDYATPRSLGSFNQIQTMITALPNLLALKLGLDRSAVPRPVASSTKSTSSSAKAHSDWVRFSSEVQLYQQRQSGNHRGLAVIQSDCESESPVELERRGRRHLDHQSHDGPTSSRCSNLMYTMTTITRHARCRTVQLGVDMGVRQLLVSAPDVPVDLDRRA